MLKFNVRKILACGIILLFVGTSVVPSTGMIEELSFFVDDDEFDQRIMELMELGHMPSLVACIVKNNTTVWSKGYGHSSYYPPKINATNVTAYPIASITKSITATAIMQLYETGLIDLDENVSKYLPFDLKNPRYRDINITFRMLLAHQSSLRDNGLRFGMFNRIFKNPNNWLKFFFSSSRAWYSYAPGMGVCYSIGTIILGLIIENVTKQSYVDYCQEHIFDPLEMWNTSFYFSDFDKDILARLYLWGGSGNFFHYFPLPYIQIPSIEFPFGGLKTTVLDLSHYLIMHTSGGVYNDVRILNESSVEEMHTHQYPGYYLGNLFSGFGWWGNEIYGGHGGNSIGAYAIMKMRYSDKVGVIFFWNQNSFFRVLFNCRRQEEIDAIRGIGNALFKKADEF